MAMDVVRIAELKARLSEHLRAVRRGRTIIVGDS
jgi:antitoxin (DNA-binding transcriptional repressor) of toxin-antitoxin stability system